MRYTPTKGNRLGWNDNLYDRFYFGLQMLGSHIVSLNVEYDYSRPSAWSETHPVSDPTPRISTLGLRLALTM